MTTCDTPVSWFWARIGVSSDGENRIYRVFFLFFDQKKGKGEISDIISRKTTRKKTTFFTKRNAFSAKYYVVFFLVEFLTKKGQT